MNPHGKRLYGSRGHHMELNLTDGAYSLRPSLILNGPMGAHVNDPSPSFPYARNTIPGLGLDFLPQSKGPQTDKKPGALVDVSQPFRAAAQEPSSRPPRTGDSNINVTAECGDGMVDVSEEGEIPEGEIQDNMLCPEGPGNPTTAFRTRDRPLNNTSVYGRQASPTAGACAPTEESDLRMEWLPGHHAPAKMARERSGSYSPYLSPREINNGSLAQAMPTPELHSESPRLWFPNIHYANEACQGRVKISQPTVSSTESSCLSSAKVSSSPFNTLQLARKQARDAIKKLIPLNIKYQNFLEEGIDDAVLGPLFDDLGISTHKDVRQSQVDAIASKAVFSIKSSDMSAYKSESLPSKPALAESPKTADKSEERKDRIARLLAAKGSKPAAAISTLAQAPVKSPPSALIPTAQPCPKAQTEKSKLLQHKMEALRKSRENMAQAKGLQSAKEPIAVSSELADNLVSEGAAIISKATASMPDVTDLSKEVNLSDKPSPSIPGLFLSSTPQPPLVPASYQTHRSSFESVNSTKRPFDQKVETGPFLINVSDDEDDAEMDVDMPAQPLTERCELSPQKAAMSKEYGHVMDKPLRYDITQIPAVTPSRSSSHNSGIEDLASMNKKIEAMKRKIAEAEARKRTKLSRQMSPTGSQPNESSRDGSLEAGSLSRDSGVPSPLLERSCTPCNDDSVLQTAAIAMPRIQTSTTRQSGSDEAARRHSRSRAASERLPFIEARRREQIEKLKELQSQIAKIEQEIREGIQEEEVLKQDLEDADSDEAASRSAILPGERVILSELPRDDLISASSGRHEIEQTIIIPSVTYHGFEASMQSINTEDTEYSPAINSRVNCENDSLTDKREMIQGSLSSNRDELNADDITNAGCSAHTSPEQEMGNLPVSISTQSELEHDNQNSECDSVIKDSEPMTDQELGKAIPIPIYEPPATDLSESQDMISSIYMRDSGEQERLTVFDNTVKDKLAMLDISSQQIPTISRETSNKIVDYGMISLKKPVPENTTTSWALCQSTSAVADLRRSHFIPYETPLQYFRAYRFHPEFRQTVTGGLRSLTYSNKIDVRKIVCPDELNEFVCPRGIECQFQHFDHMKVSDDQILLQLGVINNYHKEQRQKYISGLRQLLMEFRNNKEKDFNIISQGIIDYRAKFLGDRSKILPLGSVTI